MCDDNASHSDAGGSSESDCLGQQPLVQAAQRLLDESCYWHLRHICCKVEGNIITMRGRVPSYYLKQIAQHLVGKVEGVEVILNLVDVVGPDTWHHVHDVNPPTA